jgi:hypothetical protein
VEPKKETMEREEDLQGIGNMVPLRTEVNKVLRVQVTDTQVGVFKEGMEKVDEHHDNLAIVAPRHERRTSRKVRRAGVGVACEEVIGSHCKKDIFMHCTANVEHRSIRIKA